MNQAHRRERFRGCSNPRCRICHRWLSEPQESTAESLLGAAALVLVFIAFALILPVLAGTP